MSADRLGGFPGLSGSQMRRLRAQVLGMCSMRLQLVVQVGSGLLPAITRLPTWVLTFLTGRPGAAAFNSGTEA
jgi:hypothetical protein